MKTSVIAVISVAIVVGLSIVLTGGLGSGNSGNGDSGAVSAQNVSIVDGKQVIEIGVKGGYSPRVSVAKAGLPTVLRLETRGSFDCSSALSIAALGFRQNLPASGTTEVEVPPQKAGSVIQGVCAMGMYSFRVNFN